MIGLWMLSVIVLGALIALGGTFLAHLSTRLRVPRRWLWLTLMAMSVSLPIGMALRPASVPRPEPNAAPPSRATRGTSPPLNVTDEGQTHTRNQTLLFAWAAASLCLAGVFVLSHRRIRMELAGCERRELLGATVAVSPDFGPAAVGLLRSEVVLPEWVFDLPHDEQQLVLRHELEHIRAGDHFVLLAGVTIAVLMPWNLALWWQLRRLRVGMEVDCDARVAPTLRDRPRYAELLLRARNHRKVHRLALALVPAPSALAERLMALLESAKLSAGQVVTWSAAALACGVVVTRVPVPNLNSLLKSAPPARGAVAMTPKHVTAEPTTNGNIVVPNSGTVVSSRAPQQHPRYDSLIPVPVVGAPGHPRYDSLVPYVPGRPVMARGTYVGPPRADTGARPDTNQDEHNKQ